MKSTSIQLLLLLILYFTFVTAIHDNTIKLLKNDKYYSETSRSTISKVVDKWNGEPLMAILQKKPLTKSSNLLEQNPIKMIFKSQKKSIECFFEEYDDLCVIEDKKVDNEALTLEIQCKQLPCDVSWSLYQSHATSIVPKSPYLYSKLYSSSLYQIPSNIRHIIFSISLDGLNVTSLEPALKVYSTNSFVIQKFPKYWNWVLQYCIGIKNLNENNRTPSYFFIKISDSFNQTNKTKANIVTVRENIPITGTTQIHRDFTLAHSSAIFKLEKVPKSDFFININWERFGLEQIQKNNIQFKITAETTDNKERQTLYSHKLQSIPISKTSENKYYFSFIMKKISKASLKNVQIEIYTDDEPISMNIFFIFTNKISINSKRTYNFNLKKDQKLSLSYSSNKYANKGDIISIKTPKATKNKFTINETICDPLSGCQLQILALENVDSSFYLRHEIQFFNSITSRGNKNEIQYFKTLISPQQIIKFTLNSSNVIAYMGKQGFCYNQEFSQKCSQNILEFNKPVEYQSSTKSYIYFAVNSSQYDSFSITRKPQALNNKNPLPYIKSGENFQAN